MSQFTQEKPVCVVTGGSAGIGLAIAQEFAQKGYGLVICGRNSAKLNAAQKTIQEAGQACEAFVLDLQNSSSAKELVQKTQQVFGRVDVLVNNAGTAPMAPLDSLTEETFRQNVGVNIEAVFHTTQTVWPIMKSQGGGIIINISSLASVDPFPGFNIYGASKAWVNLFSKSVADEGKPLGIRVYSVALGAVDTELLRGLIPDFPTEQALSPTEVASFVGTLCEENMRHLTGQTLFLKK